MPISMKATHQLEPRPNPFSTIQSSPAAPPNPLAALAGANAFGFAAANPGIYENTAPGGGANQHAMDMAAGGRGRRCPPTGWRSPYNNPGLEYVYLGSPQTSQGSPQSRLPDPVTSFPANDTYNLQPTPGNVSQQQQQQQVFARTFTQPGYAPVAEPPSPYVSQRLAAQQVNHRAETQPQASTHELGDVQQFDDIWSSLESVEYTVTPDDIRMVEAFAPSGFNLAGGSVPGALGVQPRPSVAPPPTVASAATEYRAWPMLPSHPEEAESSCSGQAGGPPGYNAFVSPKITSTLPDQAHAFPQRGQISGQTFPYHHHHGGETSHQAFSPLNAGHGAVGVEPRSDFVDMVMDDQSSDGISSSASPGAEYQTRQVQQQHHQQQQPPQGYGFGGFRDHHLHHPAGERSSQPENNFRDQVQGNLPAFAGAGASQNEGKPMESEFSTLLAPGLSGIRNLGEPRWAEQLLNLCAAAIASKNISRTQHLMWVLNDLASVVGDANQRFAAYGLRALFCRITGRMEAAETFLRPRHKEQEVSFGPKTVHRALVKFHEYVPWHQNCYTVTSQTLLEVCAGKSRLHLIDIGAGKGIEWPIFIDALVSRSGGPPSILRMTMIRDLRREELNMHTAKSVNSEAADFMTRLVKFASLLGLHVEVNMVQKPLECVTREDLGLRDGEILAVVCQFRLHRLSEEPPMRQSACSPLRLSPRDEFLEFLYKLEPHVFILSDNNADHCSADFLTRFQSAMGFWWRCFEAIDVGYNGRDPEERQIIEYEGAMMLLNMVACEGIARIERNEAYAQWERRVRKAGFVPRDLSEETKKCSQDLVQNHSEFWEVAFSPPNMVNLQWRKQPTTFTSVWNAASCSKSACKCSMLHS